MNKLSFPVVLAAMCLSACSGGGANSEKLIGSWTCDGPSRPNMEFKAGGLYLKDTLGDPNSPQASGRASTEINGTYKIDGSSVTMTPTQFRLAVEPQDLAIFLQASHGGQGRLSHIRGTTFELAPGKDQTVMSFKFEGNSATFQLTRRIDAQGNEVKPPNGTWKPFECVKSSSGSKP